MSAPTYRPLALPATAPMRLAPANELGVVFIFAQLLRRWRLRVEEMGPAFPDCIAYQKSHGRERKIRIEFEYKSKNFRSHGHRADRCDWIVCWEHDWPGAPRHLHILELRRELGLGFSVWIVPISARYGHLLASAVKPRSWRVPASAKPGDLLLSYVSRPVNAIVDVCMVTGAPKRASSGDFRATVVLLAHLGAPLFLEDLKADRILRTAGFVRSSVQTRQNATEHWPHLYEKIVKRNRTARAALRSYRPDLLPS